MNIQQSTRKDKRLMAIFPNGKIIHFGSKTGSTYIDHKDKQKRLNYIARHGVNENWTDPYAAATLSRYILWEKPTLSSAISNYMRLFPAVK